MCGLAENKGEPSCHVCPISISAIVFLVVGIGMGLKMAISQDHTTIGAHAHANLLGWVTMVLFGTYYALNPRKAEKRLALLQYGVYTLGVVLMVPSLYLLLEGHMAMEPLVGISSLITLLGVLMFAVVIFSPDPATGRAPMAAAR